MQRMQLKEKVAEEIGRGEGINHPHQAYLEVLLDNGLIGFVIIVGLYMFILVYSARLFVDRGDPLYTTAGGLAFLSRLRADSAAFCDAYEASIASIAESAEPDDELLAEASEEGLFAEIKKINDLVESALDEILIGMGEGIERWTFAVTFSIRTLLSRQTIERIDANLREILYADPEGIAPPFDVPEEIFVAMERLIGLSGRALTDREAKEVIEVAASLYEYFMGPL